MGNLSVTVMTFPIAICDVMLTYYLSALFLAIAQFGGAIGRTHCNCCKFLLHPYLSIVNPNLSNLTISVSFCEASHQGKEAIEDRPNTIQGMIWHVR
jgi:hypothetical protein